MIFLPDVNVWIALTHNRHVHHSLAKEWLQAADGDEIAFCRITELGFLRLMGNLHVMGKASLPAADAWRVYVEWRSDGRVVFLPERLDFSEQWQPLANNLSGGPNLWTDAYLAAFALHVGATVVTLDRRFPPLGKASVQILT